MDDPIDNAPTSTPPLPSGLSDSPFGQVPIEISISVGRAHPLIGDLATLGMNSVLPLDRRIDDPVELYVGGRLIARGTLMEMEGDEAGRLAVCLTEVADPGRGL